MCHLVRDAEFERQRAQQSLPPSEMTSPRPRRLVGAVAAAVVAVVVAAVALLFPASTPAVSTSQPAAPVVSVEQTSSGLDDGVPTTTASRDGGSGCSSHEL
jgi:hypothetical protein